MSNQRKLERKKLLAFTLVYNRQPKTLLGYLMDLTVGGAQVEGERAVEVDQPLNLSIEFPSGMSEAPNFPFQISARAVRSQKDESGKHYHTGFEFTEVTPEQRRILEAIIERYSFHRKPLNNN
jgi:c-di-GMP-binding flagellar brake protein YcgR